MNDVGLHGDGAVLPVRLVAVLVLIMATLSPPAAKAVTDEVRSLLRELRIQMPSREVGAPPLSLPDLDGSPVRLADHSGRVVMLYFWTTY